MPRPTLSKTAVKLIHAAVEELFNRAKARVLGFNFFKPPKRIYVTADPNFSLAGLFDSASIEERNRPNEELLHSLLRIAEGYINVQQQATQTHIVKSVESFLQDAYQKGVKTDVKKVLGGELEAIWAKTTDAMYKIVNTEANQVKNVGLLDGISKVNAAAGIEDPVVALLGPLDEHVCEECKRLCLLEDGITPRCWYLSEMGNGYHKKGDESPKISGLHPNCRHSLISVMPGYGFKNGSISYISPEHNEIEKQRNKAG